jgi:hypothetical protein
MKVVEVEDLDNLMAKAKELVDDQTLLDRRQEEFDD